MKQLILLIMFSFSLFANNIDELMVKSGLNEQIKQLKESSVAYANLISRDENNIKKFTNNFNKYFNNGILMEKTKEYLQKNLTSNEIEELLQWFNSPIGYTIVHEEIKSSSADVVNEMVLMLPELAKDQTRVQKAIELEKILNFTDQYLNFTILLFNKLIPKEMINSQKMNNFFENYKKQAYNQIIAINLYTHRNISNENLDLYFEFLSKNSSQKFSDTIFKVQSDVVLDWVVKSIKESDFL